jgi:hypothetical protein
MIIYGWGFTTEKKYGPTFKNKCKNCNNEEYWILKRIISWFTLFFIPVIPYKTQYFLYCPVCEHGLFLDGDQTEKIRPLATLNQELIDEKITQAEYVERRRILSTSTSVSEPQNTPTESNAQKEITTPAKHIKSKFCSECGNPMLASSKFCSECGKAKRIKPIKLKKEGVEVSG